MSELIEAHRKQFGDDMLSVMATDDGPEGRMSQSDLVSTATLLLIGEHETTVNLISNGVLTLLRHPVLPLDMVDNSTSSCKRISGCFYPHSTVQGGHFILELPTPICFHLHRAAHGQFAGRLLT